ncbi:MAG: hypothetical protein HC901_01985 [Bdellovibrionaceae bacterium]|nr:hypothetical protein [Pseudobdellovibrionaceae bacterium]
MGGSKNPMYLYEQTGATAGALLESGIAAGSVSAWYDVDRNGPLQTFAVGNNGSGSETRWATLEFRVVPGAPVSDPYELWTELFGGSVVIGTETEDHDGDGLSNLEEYGLDGDPTDRMDRGTPPVIYREGGSLFYSHPQRSDDASLVYTIETCTDLVLGNWTPAGFTLVDTELTGSTLDFVTYAIPTTEPKLFLRLQITR